MDQLETKKLIYIIDDDEDILILLKKILNNLGMIVETFQTPDTFIKRLKEKVPDLCFIDLNLGVNVGAGFQLIQAIRRKISEDVVLIVISARSSSEDTTMALEYGCDDYIVKPIKAALIENKLKQHLKHEVEITVPMISVPEDLRACSFNLESYISNINEEGFTLLTAHFIPKNTEIEFSSGVMFEIMQKNFSLRVKNNWVHVESGLYAYLFVFPPRKENIRMHLGNGYF